MTDVSSRLAGLSPRKRALLLRLLEREGKPAEPRGIPRQPRDQPLPLSFAQQRLWLLQQLDPESTAYVFPLGLRLEGALRVAALAAGLSEIRRRHEVLRTVLVERKGRPVQVIQEPRSMPMPVVDLSHLESADRDRQLRQIHAAEGHRPFDLARGPLWRVCLLRFTDTSHRLLLTLHHAVFDGWSLGLMIGELRHLYQAATSGAPSPLPELPIQYADYAVWQEKRLAGELAERQLEYWRRSFEGAEPLELLSDRPRPAVESHRGTAREIALAEPLTEALRQMGQSHGTSPFMTLLAAFSVLLARHAARPDVVVGTPISNRNRGELEGLVGCFLNTLALRVDLRQDISFRQVLAEVRKTALGGFEHQDLPFEQLVEKLEPERDLSRHPLFQVMFNLLTASPEEIELPGLALRSIKPVIRNSLFDLSLEMVDARQLTGRWVYNTDLFDATTIHRLSRRFEILLAAMVDDVDADWREISLLTAAEAAQLRQEWNDRRAVSTWDGVPIHRLVAERARRWPETIAVSCDDQHWTYDELSRRAGALAERLRHLGVGPETLVGLLVEHSADMVIGALSILEAGGAYLPLDPSYPRERLEMVSGDSGISLLVTRGNLGDLLGDSDLETLRLERLGSGPALGEGPPKAANPAANPDSLAYVIYTSGSTGRPKGVEVTHRSLVNFLASMRRRPGLEAGETLLAVTTLSFDIAGLEIFLPLLSGARLEIAPHEVTIDGERLIRLLATSRASAMQATPATWQLLLGAGWQGQPGLRALCGGEALPPRLAARLLDAGCELWNLYGPTETTVWSAETRITRAGGSISLGRPIANTEIHLLDRRLRPVPLGVAGELTIGGDGLARGYRQRPALTAERFIPDPFSRRDSARLYRTGDLASRRADGRLEFLGRLDHQVKLRGFRIELGDIEATLEQHPDVSRAVTVLRKISGSAQLVAYVATTEAQTGDLRQHLRQKLPAYMVPAAIVRLDELPLTANGKVDRRALPDPGQTSAEATEYQPPRDEVEQALVEVWQQVLDVDRVGIRDSFFDLGGHSLLGTMLLSRVRDALGVHLPLRQLFEGPTVAALAARVREDRRRGTGDATALAPALTRVPREGPLPLSFAQQRLWLLAELEPDNPFYNLPGGVYLSGDLDLGRLRRAFQTLFARHDSLRTRFRAEGGEPFQIVSSEPSFELPLVDLSRLDAGRHSSMIARLARWEACRPFDLGAAPLMRALLVRTGEARHALLFTIHHIVSDAWSNAILVREIASLYEHDGADALPELTLQYGDYAAWQRGWFRGEALEGHLDFWRRRLAGEPTLELPTDRPRPAVQTYRGAAVDFAFDTELSAAVLGLGRRSQTSLFMTLLGAFNLLLARHSGQRDMVVGTPVANRSRAELEDLIGFFVNTLVLRLEVDDAWSFEQLQAETREVTLEAFAHQDLPFEKLVEELHPRRDLSRNPLFQVMFNLLNQPVRALDLSDLTLSPVDLAGEEMTSLFDLTLYVWQSDDGIRGKWEYNTDLFDRTTIERWSRRWTHLLNGAAADSEAPVASLSLIPRAERHQLLREHNATALEVPDRPLPRLFAEQVARTPDAPAVGFEGRSWNYLELATEAHRVARGLHRLGIGGAAEGRENRIALSMARSPEMLAAALGVLEAGAAYVPVDPNYPRERRQLILEDSAVAVVLTDEQHRDDLPTTRARVLTFDELTSDVEPRDTGTLEPVALDQLAYVIYTSGSTGRPKGVQISHRALVNFLESMRRQPGLDADDVLLAVTSLSFDIAGLELFLPLITGARLEIAAQAVTANGERLGRLLESSGTSVMQATPATWQMLLDAGWQGLPGLRALCGGEALPTRLASRLLATGVELWNLYGPTETTVWSATTRVDRVSGPIALGRPIANTQIHLLDRRLRPVPTGVAGELTIGGMGLARGYYDRPALTAERFVPDALSGEADARLYRTGDLTRQRPDGILEFLGRLDHQIKLRGYRIELGEIEAVLEQLPEVARAVAVLRQDSGDARLVAYVLPESTDAVAVAALRQHLGETVPAYMVPSAFVVLDELPLTANGKVDRRALPAPGQQSADAAAYEAPRDPVEQALADVWQQVLDVERVGIRDSFFDLGGHSLLGTMLLSRVRDALGINLPLRHLFEGPTVAELAARVHETRRGEQALEAPPLEPMPREGPLPVSFAQQRLWFLAQLEPDNPFYNLPGGVFLHGDLDQQRLHLAFQSLVDRHETLRTSFRDDGGKPSQAVAEGLSFGLPLVDLSSLGAERRRTTVLELARQEAQRPFDLRYAPLLRAVLIRTARDQHALLFNTHHIVSDAWSNALVVQEIASVYEHGDTRALPELKVQYTDYAAWQQRWLQGQALESQLDYWRRQLAGEPVLELPTDRPRPAIQTYRGGAVGFVLDADLSAAVEGLGQTSRASLFMTLLGAFKLLLARHSGQRDTVVGTPIANRTRSEVEGIVGFFVNTLVLRLGLDDTWSFRQLLDQTRDMALEAYAYQDLPFEKLVEELHPRRDLSRNPLFQVMFNLLNPPAEAIELPGLALSPIEQAGAETISLFDLTLNVWHSEGRIGGRFEYNSDLFDRSTITRWSGRFQSLLRSAAADPEAKVLDLSLLPPAERQQVVFEWNATDLDVPTRPLPALFAEQAARQPEVPAVSFEGRSWSYRELATQTRRLSRHLGRLGIGDPKGGREARVAISMARSPEMLAAVLGVLEAGGAYVPVDPTYPRERRQLILEDSAVAVVLTDEHHRADLPSTQAQILTFDELPAEDPTDDPATPLDPESWERRHPTGIASVDLDQLAYVIYTSGSTGRPKGVEINHRTLVNFLTSMRRRPGLDSGDVLLAVTSLSFDIATLELFLPLLVGARVEIVSTETAADGVQLAARLESSGATVMQATPATWQMLLAGGWHPQAALRVLCGGEAMPARLAARLTGGGPVWNLYGPTETTVWSTVARIEAAPDVETEASRPVTIGAPIANTRISILDRGRRPAPAGVAGELLISGNGVARGYHERPALTAERFVPEPLDDAGARAYRTGDLARWISDGQLEFLGRLDHQVKLRGFRIELGEIESVLLRHPSVRETAVSIHGAETDAPILVAYVVPADAATPAGELRAHLEASLPGYMVPSMFIGLDALPLTPNRKVDRRALPAPDGARPTRDQEYVAPSSPSEQTLATIFADILRVDKIGIHDDFFQLGGHSLLATQVASQIREAFGIEIAVRTLFEAPTVAALDEVVLKAQMDQVQDDEMADLLAQLEGMSLEEAADWAGDD